MIFGLLFSAGFSRLLSNNFKATFYLSTSKDSEVLRNIEAGSPTCKKYE